MLKIPFQFFWNIQNFVLWWKQSVWREKSIFWGLLNFRQNCCSRTLPACPFFCWFWVFFEIMKIPFQFFWNIQNFVLSWKQSLWRKKSMFWGLFNFRENRCIRTLPAWPFFGWFWVFFEMLKIPFQFFWNIQNFFLSWKQSLWRKKDMFWVLFNLDQNRCIRTLPAWPFLGWFWVFFEMLKIPFPFFRNIQSFVLSKKQSVWRKKSIFWGLFNFRENRCIRTLPAWPFFGWFWLFFEILKIPFEFLWNIQNFFLSWKQSLWRKKRHVLGTFQFGPKSMYPDLTGMVIFWLILSILWNNENTLPILLKPSKFCSFMKTIGLKKKSMFWGLLNFSQNRVSGTYRHAIFWVILTIFWNIENNIPIFRKHSTFCSFMKRIGLKKKKHVLGTFQFLAKSLYPDLTGVAIFWLILSIFWNVENTLQILVKHSKFCSLMKTISLKKKKACFGYFSIWTKIDVSGPYRHGHFLVDFEYFLK